MLEELHVRNLALIDEVWLEFGPGMTVLTGETGAGKTALLGALKLVLGERADSGSVKAGESEAAVEARFSSDVGELLVRRRVTADGRSRCVLDGEMATVGALTERIGPLVDLLGQHEHQALLSAASHVGYLDRWIGEPAAEAAAAYRDARAAYRAAIAEAQDVERRLAEAERNADYLRFMASEIEAVDPQPREDDELASRLPALQHAERLAEAADAAARSLRGDGGAMDRLAEAAAALARVDGIDPALDEIATRTDELIAVADDIGTAAREYRDGLERDPEALEATMSRLNALAGLMKKYGPTLDEVLESAERARRAVSESDDAEESRARAARRVEQAAGELRESAARLNTARSQAAAGFASALEAASRELAMPEARFEVALTPLPFDEWTDAGAERVEFLYAPVASQPARPLARIASGGEISRVMLALKGVLGQADSVGTLVFDEVDAGIGGATASAVGQRLAALAKRHQVIVVTHLAQVAAYADGHLVVARDGGGATTVTPVTGEDRVAEVARMLSGNDSEASMRHARELLERSDAASPSAGARA